MQKALYMELFAVIGYTYGGSGDYFNLPNLTDGKFLEYRTDVLAGIIKQPGLPNITGGVYGIGHDVGMVEYYGAFYGGGESNVSGMNSRDYNNASVQFNASRSNAIFGRSNTVQPYSMTVIPIIKVK